MKQTLKKLFNYLIVIIVALFIMGIDSIVDLIFKLI